MAGEQFSIESEKTEHRFTVNYAKYEYVESIYRPFPDSRYDNRHDIPMHFTFIEFATWNDAMKSMWDGFSLMFMTFICTFFPDADSEDVKDQMGKHIGKTENILTGTKIPYLVVIVNKDLYSSEDGTTEDFAGVFPLPSQFPGSEKSRAIEAPGLGKWGQDEEYDRRLWFYYMCRFREEAIGTSRPLDASLKGKSHW